MNREKVELRILLAGVLIFFIGCVATNLFAYQEMQDAIYLKNGGITKGQIIEQVPGVSFKIQTKDGSVFVYKASEVLKITKEPISSQRKEQYNRLSLSREYRNPGTATLWSFFIIGGGQIYNGETGKGLLFMAGAIYSFANLYEEKEEYVYSEWGYGYYNYTYEIRSEMIVAYLGCWIWSMVDANSSAKRINATLDKDFSIRLKPNGFELVKRF